jgi:tRNA threonylcarbamoyl adenosine modification protein YjeE
MKNQEWHDCSEKELQSRAQEWVRGLRSEFQDAIVFLEGEMGAGKSTFARAILAELSPHQVAKGSPTFPIVHEYPGDPGRIYHIDLYRIRHESELEDSGILSQIEERGVLAIIEWSSLFPDVFAYWKTPQETQNSAKKTGATKTVWQVTLSPGSHPEFRNAKLARLSF